MKSTNRQFKIGQQVLGYTSKRLFLLANEFPEPFRILKESSDRTYVTEISGKRKNLSKALSTSITILQTPDLNKKFLIQVDPSHNRTGAVLFQEDKEGILHPACVMSSKLKKQQRVESTVETELLAMIAVKFLIDMNRP
ncbi:uncharacterized protein [Palaemon carinicauda]|uniref:uncharacterized protein n=1 Tax=Palaemon carinicauda TaxID=392227 RepID=UPI0035B5E228